MQQSGQEIGMGVKRVGLGTGRGWMPHGCNRIQLLADIGRTELGWSFRNVLNGGKKVLGFVRQHQPVIGCKLPWREGVGLGKLAVFGGGKFLGVTLSCGPGTANRLSIVQ